MRQFTVPIARCGSAFSAWPAFSIVATQVVRISGSNSSLEASAAAASASFGFSEKRRSISATCGCEAFNSFAIAPNEARVTLFA